MFTWIDGNVNTLIATLNPNSIILNQKAASYFCDVRFVSVGLDSEKKLVAIHPVTKQELDLSIFTPQQLHKISIGNGYAKVSNTNLNTMIANQINRELNNVKFNCYFDEESKHLIIDLNQEVKKEN